MLSSKALSKEGFVQKELKTALEILDYLPSGRAFVIPARIDDCEPADEKLQDIHWADLFPSYEDGLSKILKALAPNRAETPTQPQNIAEKPAPIISKPKPEEKPAPQPEAPKPQIRKPEYQLRKEPMTVSGDDAERVLFDKNQLWCWTSDKRASGGAWFVDFYYGGVNWYNASHGYVRAVRSRQ